MEAGDALPHLRRDLNSTRHWLHVLQREATGEQAWRLTNLRAALKALDDVEAEVLAMVRRGLGPTERHRGSGKPGAGAMEGLLGGPSEGGGGPLKGAKRGLKGGPIGGPRPLANCVELSGAPAG